MNLKVLDDYLYNFPYSFEKKSLALMKDMVDPNSFKYQKIYKILDGEKNHEMNISSLTKKQFQLALIQLYLQCDRNSSLKLNFDLLANFLLNCKQSFLQFFKQKNEILKVIMVLLVKIFLQWRKQFNSQIKKAQKTYQSLIQLFTEVLVLQINAYYIKNQRHKIKIGYHQFTSPLSPPSPMFQQSLSQSNVNAIQNNSTNVSSNSNVILHQNSSKAKQLQIKLEFDGKNRQVITIMSEVYLLMLGIKYFNNQSKCNISQFNPRISNKTFQKSNFKQESTFFNNLNFHQSLLHSLHIIFYLPNSLKHFPLCSILFQLCSYLFIFNLNFQKPVSLLRFVLFNQTKLTKAQWQFHQIDKEQESQYYWLLDNYIKLDPQFKSKTLKIISTCIDIGIQTQNRNLLAHWRVLIELIKQKIFDGVVSEQMFKLLISKSEGNIQAKMHIRQLLNQMFLQLQPQYFIQNCQIVLSLQEFLSHNKVKLCQMFFQHYQTIYESSTKQISNKRIINRIIQLYISIGKETTINRERFLQFFFKILQKSVSNNQKMLSQTLLKQIHMIHVTNQMKSQYNFQQMPVNLRQSNYRQIQKIQKQVYQFQEQLLKIIFQNVNQKGQSYYSKFIKDPKAELFTCFNTSSYQIYLCHALQKLTNSNINMEHIQKNIMPKTPIIIKSNPAHFNKYKSMFQTLFEYINHHKVLSFNIFKLMITIQSIIEQSTLSPRYQWYLRKFKYIIKTQPQKELFLKIPNSPNEAVSTIFSDRRFYGKIQDQSNQGQVGEQLFQYLKQYFIKIKSKISLLLYLSNFASKLFFEFKQRRKLNFKDIKNNKQVCIFLKQLKQLFTKSQYLKIQSYSVESVYMLFIIFHIHLLEQHSTNVSQQIISVDNKRNKLFLQKQPLDCFSQIIKQWSSMFDYFFENQLIHLFTFKQSIGHKLILLLNLPFQLFQSISISLRLTTLIKVLSKLVDLDQNQNKLYLGSNFNHIEIQFLNHFKKQKDSLLMKNQEINYKLGLNLVINQNIQIDNFLSLHTTESKYKIILRQNQICLLKRKNGLDKNQMKKFQIKQNFGQVLFLDIILTFSQKNSNQIQFIINKINIFKIAIQGNVQSLKLQMIGHVILKKINIALSCSEIHYNSQPIKYDIALDKSFSSLYQVQVQTKIKNLNAIPFKKFYFKDNKFLVILKELFKHNTELLQDQPFFNFWKIVNEMILKIIQKITSQAQYRKSYVPIDKAKKVLYGNQFVCTMKQLLKVMIQKYDQYHKMPLPKNNRKYSSNQIQTPKLKRSYTCTSNQEEENLNNNLNLPILPQIQRDIKVIESNKFYYYFLLTCLNKTVWKLYSYKTKIIICKYLKNLLNVQNFKIKLQNLDFQLFFNLANIFCLNQDFLKKEDNQIQEDKVQEPKGILLNCLKKIIMTHQTNIYLKQKFKYYFYLSENNQCSILKTTFYEIIQSLAQNLIFRTQQNQKIFKISKYIFIDFQQFQYVFINCNIEIKIKILDYLALSQNQNKLQQFLKQLTPKIILELKLWLIVFIKKLLFELTIKKNKVLEIMKLLGMITERLLSCWEEIREEQQKQQLLKIIKQQIKYIRNRQKQNLYISPQLLKILRDQEFMKFLITIIEQYVVLRKKTDLQIQKFLITVFEVLFSLQKKQLLEVFIKYRKFANKNIGVLLYPVQLQLSKQLQLYQLNCFLQFIIQSILSIQNSLSEEELFYYAIVLKQYLQYLFKYYQKFSSISGALLYTYPKHYHSLAQQSKSKIKKQMKKLNEVQALQLKGGIYYKLMMIVAHLIQMKKDEDLSFLVQELLFKKLSKQKQISVGRQQRTSLANLRAVNDFTELKFYNKERTFVEIIINQLTIDHKSYFLENDQPLKSQQVTSSKTIKFQQENDLTPYYIDYFLMKLVIYLQWLEEDSDSKTDSNNKKYSQLVLKAFQKYPPVYEDIAEQNIDSRICVNDYYQLVLLTQDEQDLTITQQVYSPHSRIQNVEIVQPVFSPHNQQQTYPELQSPRKQIKMYQNGRFSKTADKKQIQSNFLQVTPNPKKTTNRRKSFDITQHIKQKQNLISEIKENHHIWRSKCLQKQFNKYFRDQAKQLLLFQLIHTYFVQNSQVKPKSQLFQKTNQVIQKYFQIYQEELENIQEQLQSSILKSKHLIKSLGIKLIAPYLIDKDPIYKIKANYFPNFCLPILSKIPVRNYKLRQKNLRNLSSLVNEQDLNMSIIEGINKNNLEEQIGQFQIKQELIPSEDKSFSLRIQSMDERVRSKSYICIQDKSVQSFEKDQKPRQIKYCQLVTRKGVMFCQWRIFSKKKKDEEGKIIEKNSFLQITSLNQKSSHGPRYLKYGSPQSNLLLHQNKFLINLTEIKEILYRKYNQIENNSIQIFQTNGRSHFVCMYQKQRAEQLIKQIRNIRGKKLKIIKNLVKQFQERNYTNKWASGEIDNFTYLMLINKFSSRSFCDTNQYPIFPWVIADFNSEELDLTKRQTYRDLNLPVGALNSKKLDKFYQKYNMQSQDTGFYLYGSHYSTSLFIYYFLVRMEPFSSLHQQMQGGNWDVPDRLFSSIPHMWESLMSQSSPTDIKQAIPQFYYFPSFLKNINNIQLGKRQSGQLVNDVALPKWAKTAQQFVLKMRSALQSTYVSLNLPHWIDLIFGVSQKDIKKHNLFHPLSYSQNIHIENVRDNVLEATVCQISFFGQCPSKLFSSQHKQRKLALPNIFSKDLLSGSLIRTRSSSNVTKNNNFGKYILSREGLINNVIKCPNNKSKCYIFFRFEDDKQEGILQFDCENDQIQFISKKMQMYSKYSPKQRQRNYKQKKQQISKSYPPVNKSEFDSHYVGYAQLSSIYIQSQRVESQIRIVFKENKRILSSFIFPHTFTSYFYNQMFLVLYGNEGLFIYDWKYQLYWKSNCKQVIQCFVQDQLIFFANRNGQIYLFDFTETKSTKIFDFESLNENNNKESLTKDKTYDLMMILFHPKIGINNSQFQDYKFFVVQNKRKIRVLSYKHQRLNWLKQYQKQFLK